MLGEATGFVQTKVSEGMELDFVEHVNVLNLRTYLLMVLMSQDIPPALAEKVVSQDIFAPPKRVEELPSTLPELKKALRPTACIVANLADVQPVSALKSDFLGRFTGATSMEELKEAQRNSKACALALAPHPVLQKHLLQLNLMLCLLADAGCEKVLT